MQIFWGDFSKKLLVEVFIVKNQQINHGYRDISIGQVENCTEEVVAAIDQEIEESGNAVPLKERKVEHIHDFAHHESCVVASEMGDRVGCGGREDQPVKGAVDDVADRSGQNQPESDQHSFGRFLRMKWRISQISATTMPIRKRPKSSLPQSIVPGVAMCMPKAAPLFSMK